MMNLNTLEYIVALDAHRNFVKAAQACGVSQPTLSTMIKNLEAELDVVIFDRNSHPVRPTIIGEKIIAQAKVTLSNAAYIEELAASERGVESGSLNIGIIPTIAPYLLPGIFRGFNEKHRSINLKASEIRTSVIVEQLKKADIDIGIMATPLGIDGFLEIPLYYEKFLLYVSPQEAISSSSEVHSEELPSDHLWVLQEGHCLRNQVFNFCHKQSSYSSVYEAGSIDTLIKIVDANGGYTVIPELHLPFLNEKQKANVRPLLSDGSQFSAPVREVSLVIREDYMRERFLNILADTIKEIIPESMLDSRLKKFAIKI